MFTKNGEKKMFKIEKTGEDKTENRRFTIDDLVDENASTEEIWPRLTKEEDLTEGTEM